MKRIAIDIDGVLADFTAAYIEVINGIYPGKIPPGYQPKDWWWTDMLSKEETKAAWKVIDKSEGFWAMLRPHQENINALRNFLRVYEGSGLDIYYVTSRTTAGRKYTTLTQTKFWLDKYGLNGANTSLVIVPEGGKVSKGDIYKSLAIEASVDDRDKNVREAMEDCPGHMAYLLDRSWNKSADSLDGWRVANLSRFLAKVMVADFKERLN